MSGYTTTQEFEETYRTLQDTYKTGVTKSVKWRKWQLKQLYWMLEDNTDVLTEALQKDFNRHAFEALAYDIGRAEGDVLDAIQNCEQWARGDAPTDAGFVMGKLGKAWLRKEPLGVVLIIGAWNFPFYTALSPLAAALAAGNCIVIKPSEVAPNCQSLLADLVPKYLDQSAIRVCTGGPHETGLMLEHKFNHIFYTGSSKVGRIIATAAAKHLTPVVLELGGQAPAIITKSANVDLSAKRIAHAKLTNAGQICLNVNHLFADPAIHDELVERVMHWMKEFLKNGTDHVASIVNTNHYSRVTGLLQKTTGQIVYKGANDASKRFVHPAIITDVKQSDSLMSEELFCPYVPIMKADTQSAIETINSMPHPLGLYIFSNNQKEVDHILNSTTSGGVTINDIMIHSSVPSAPFGGVGESGYGSYHGKYGFDAFSHTRTVVTMPTYLETIMSWRYAPFKIKNAKFLEGQFPKVTFERGEGIEDQRLDTGGIGSISSIGMAIAVLSILALGDGFSGDWFGIARRVGDVLERFRS